MRNPLSNYYRSARKLGANLLRGTRPSPPNQYELQLHVESMEERMMLSATTELVEAPHVVQESVTVAQSVVIDDHGNNSVFATPLETPSLTFGRIDPGGSGPVGDKDWFSFEAVEGTTYQMKATTLGKSVRFAPFLSLYNSEIESIGRGAEGGEGGRVKMLRWTAQESGSHYLQIKADRTPGYNYSIEIEIINDDHGDDAVTLVSDFKFSGVIDSALDRDTFVFNVEPGTEYSVSANFPNWRAYSLRSFGPGVAGETEISNGGNFFSPPFPSPRAFITDEVSTQYFVEIGLRNGGVVGTTAIGDYSLTISPSSNGIIDSLGAGIAVVDNRQGNGYVLFSEEEVHSRFSDAPPPTNNADHMIAAFYNFEESQWYYDNNTGELPFTPRITDRLLAELDFSADRATLLKGKSGLVYGIHQGYDEGDLHFRANRFDGQANDGEFEIWKGATYFDADEPVRRFDIGDRGLGVAAFDGREGTGYLMFSEENVHSRFTDYPFASNADHVIAVFYEDNQWYFDNNQRRIPFLPKGTDRLLAEVDFTNDSVSDLQGQNDVVHGIALGYGSGDLTFVADQFVGRANDGEFEISEGTFFEIDYLPPKTKFNISPGLGVAAVDGRVGKGFIMHSEQDLFSRFADNPPLGSNAPHLITVFYEDNQWYYDNNTDQIAFTPRSSDRLLATVDFTNDSVTSLIGVDGFESGIRMGYADGDLSFVANQFAGTTNTGEFEVEGTFFEISPRRAFRTEVPNMNLGIAAPDPQTGTGYILYSEESVHTRFGGNPFGNPWETDPFVSNSDHLITVVKTKGGPDNIDLWQFLSDAGAVFFVAQEIRPTDRLLAQVDFDSDTVVSLQGVNDIENGIAKGYLDGDLVFSANQFAGQNNPGEFEVFGTYFESEPSSVQRFDLGPLNRGIAADDTRQGEGFILYSEESLVSRFADNPPFSSNSDNMVAVFQENGQWFYDTNAGQAAFFSVATDRLLAEINFTYDSIRSLKGSEGFEQGIAKGFQEGDLTFFANRYGESLYEPGEFQVNGSYFEVSYKPPGERVDIGQLNLGIRAVDSREGLGYILYSQENWDTRFYRGFAHAANSHHLLTAVYQDDLWFLDNGDELVAFSPKDSDRLLAAVDFTNDTVTSLEGTSGFTNGISTGYEIGDLTFVADQYGDEENNGEFQVLGSFFQFS